MYLKKVFAVSLVAISLGIGAPTLRAQGIITGSVTGTVQDSTGAVIPGATITAVNLAENRTYTSTASNTGEFNFSSLPVGTYAVTIKMAGFGDLKLGNVVVETGKPTTLGIEKLSTGSAVETVEVSTARNLLETTQAQVTTTFDSEMIQDLPTGGGLDRVALLVPGLVDTHSAGFSNTNGVGISSNGQRGRSNNFEIDGQSNNDNSVAGSQVFFQNQDAVAEIQVITNNFSAQYGRNMGSIVNYVTKSGTNAIHGSGFEFYTGSWLTALTQGQKGTQFGFCAPGQAVGTNGCKAPKVVRFVDNTYGGTLGFPIIKDKLFAFGSTLWTRNFAGSTVFTSGARYFPTKAGLATLQAAFPSNPGVAELVNFGPFAVTQGNPYSFASIDPNPLAAGHEKDVAICPQSFGVTGACPAGTPVIPFQLVGRTLQPSSFDQEHLGRLDYQATPKDRFFLRYLYQNAPNVVAGGAFASGAFYNVGDIAHSAGADWTHTFGPRWVNQIRYSFQQTTLDFDGGGFSSCTIKSLSSCPSQFTIGTTNGATDKITSLPTSISSLGLGLQTNIPQGRVVKVTQIQDNVTFNLGRHSITFGGEFDYQNSPNVFLPSISGAFATPNLNALLGNYETTLSLATGASANIHFTESDFAGYFQDDWKVTPSFTANLGLRYEFFGQSLNLLHDRSLTSQTGATPQWDTTLPINGDVNHAPTVFPFTPSFKKGFEPRIGFAWNPEAAKKLVLRGGFAINFDPAFYNIALNSYSAAPIVNLSTFTGCNGTSVLCNPAGGASNGAVHAQDDKNNPSGGSPGQKTQTRVTPNFRNPYAESYTLGIQYQLTKAATMEIRYSGNHTVGNFQTINANPTVGANASGGQGIFAGAIIPAMSTYFPVAAGSFCDAAHSTLGAYGSSADIGRQYCGNTLVRMRANTAFSIYNSLQTSVQTRNLYGFTGSAAWTYGRVIDNSSEIFSTGSGGNTNAFAQNPKDTNVGERGLAATSFKNVTSVGMVYTVPFFKHSNSLLGKAVGGLQFNTLYTFNSGQPFTPSQNYYSTLGFNLSNAATATQFGKDIFSTCDYNFNATFSGLDVCRPFVGNPNAPKGTVGINLGPAGYVDANGKAINRSQVRYIVNNVNEEQAQGTPYGNSGRNTAFGNSYNRVDFGAFKNFHITERYNLQLQTTLFNALNRAYYGTPDVYIDDAATANGASFNNFSLNNGQAFGPGTGNATGSRNIQIGAKVQF